MSTPRIDLIAILAEIDQQLAAAKDAIIDLSLAYVDRDRALLDCLALKKVQASAERAIRLGSDSQP